MDLNQLLFDHQIALIRYAARSGKAGECGSQYNLVRHCEARIARLRHDLGVPSYPQWS